MLSESSIVTLGGQTKRGKQYLGYSSTDAIATILTDGYFNDYREYMTVGDIITVTDTVNLTVYMIRIKSIPLNGNVTVDQLTFS